MLISQISGAAQPPLRPASQPLSLKIIFLGDSLTEGYGVPKAKAFPSLVETQLKADGFSTAEVINAGISGSTTASGESRLRWYLKSRPDIVLVALGGNDGLRGTPVEETKKNLEKIILLARKHQIQVLLAGMQMPPNYGAKYTQQFRGLFYELAQTYHLPMIPFLLEGVAGDPQLNQEDGIHPNETGHRKIAVRVTLKLERMISKMTTKMTTKMNKSSGDSKGPEKIGTP